MGCTWLSIAGQASPNPPNFLWELMHPLSSSAACTTRHFIPTKLTYSQGNNVDSLFSLPTGFYWLKTLKFIVSAFSIRNYILKAFELSPSDHKLRTTNEGSYFHHTNIHTLLYCKYMLSFAISFQRPNRNFHVQQAALSVCRRERLIAPEIMFLKECKCDMNLCLLYCIEIWACVGVRACKTCLAGVDRTSVHCESNLYEFYMYNYCCFCCHCAGCAVIAIARHQCICPCSAALLSSFKWHSHVSSCSPKLFTSTTNDNAILVLWRDCG